MPVVARFDRNAPACLFRGQVKATGQGDLSPTLPRRRLLHDETGNCSSYFTQFCSKIRAHQRQELGAQCRPAGHEFDQLPPVPFYHGSMTASHDIDRTGQATIDADVPDKLTGSKCHSGPAGKYGFDIAGNEDSHIGDRPALFEHDVPRRTVDPPAEIDQFQEFLLVDGGKGQAIKPLFPLAENDRSPL